MQMGGQYGMQTMDACLSELHLRRTISYETGVSRAVDAKEFARLVSSGGAGGNASTPTASSTPRAGSVPIPTTLGRGGRGG